MKNKQLGLGRLGRMMHCYVLVNHKPKRANSLKEWMDFLASPDCIVASTDIGRVNVTTAFMGIDLSSTSYGPPMFFEDGDLRRLV